MKILIYAHAFLPSTGGAETYTSLLAFGLSKTEQVIVSTPTAAGGYVDQELPYGVARRASLRRLFSLVGWADVVHLVGPTLVPLAIALLRRKVVVVEHHGYQAGCPNGLLLYEPAKVACPGHFMARRYSRCLACNAVGSSAGRSLMRLALTFLRRWLCKWVSANVAVSQHVQRRLQLSRSRVVYHGIPDLMSPPSASAGQSRSGDVDLSATGFDGSHGHPKCIAYVGRLVFEKGLPVLVEATRQLFERGYVYRLKFIGGGPERSHLEHLVSSLGLEDRVMFTGFLHGAQLEAALEDVQAVVMPTITEETAGLAVMEQMMRGRLVVASAIGGLAEVVGDAGLTFEPGDAAALAACLERVLNEPETVSSYGRRARERALRLFSLDRMVDQHLSLYRDLHKPRLGC